MLQKSVVFHPFHVSQSSQPTYLNESYQISLPIHFLEVCVCPYSPLSPLIYRSVYLSHCFSLPCTYGSFTFFCQDPCLASLRHEWYNYNFIYQQLRNSWHHSKMQKTVFHQGLNLTSLWGACSGEGRIFRTAVVTVYSTSRPLSSPHQTNRKCSRRSTWNWLLKNASKNN
jgi:hypothetical protein